MVIFNFETFIIPIFLLVDSIKESIYLTDDDFSNLDDMQHVLDLLEKAGLSKKSKL